MGRSNEQQRASKVKTLLTFFCITLIVVKNNETHD